MADTRRREAFIWVTWLSGLLSGDKQCHYALWFKAQHKYDRRADARENDLTVWKGEHAELVRRRAEELVQQGYHEVTVEHQNKFFVNGRTATLSGCPDLRARHGTSVRIEDGKTGKRRDSDYWQVLLYMLFGPRKPGEEAVSGAVVYRDSTPRLIPAGDANDATRARAVALINVGASPTPPLPTPSGMECGRCDIANCPHRAEDDPGVTIETEDF